ncbi:MAG: hypothetical protein AAF497_02220 [Planctomycetota bacterium]
MHRLYIILIVVAHLLLCGLSVLMWAQVRRFLQGTYRIETEADLLSYRSLVGSQMKMSGVAFVLLNVPWAIWLVGFVLGFLTWLDVLWVMIPFFGNIALIGKLGSPARQAKQLDASSSELKTQVDAIADVWTKKLLPDW